MAHPTTAVPNPDEGPSPFDFVNMVLSHRRLVVGIPLILFAVVIVTTFLWPRSYTAEATFMPQTGSNSLARFAGLASQLGVNLPGQDPGQSPEFYADLVGSDELLRKVVDSTFVFTQRGKHYRTTLTDLWGKSPDSLVRRVEAVKKLRAGLNIAINPKTSVVRVSMWSRSPELSTQVVSQLLDLVNWFNLQKRQSQATQEAKFTERGLVSAKADLREYEDALQRFLQRNRDFSSSPQLKFEHDRLEREVTLRTQTVNQLAQAFQTARIDEVRNTPVITVVLSPIVPAQPDRRGLVLKGLLALIGGTLFSVLLAIAVETVRRLALSQPQASARTGELLREIIPSRRRGSPPNA